MRNIKIVLEYDGANYCGWQRQQHGTSIQETLEKAASTITGEAIKVLAAGRTDAGVHAYGQVASFRCSSSLNERKLLLALNGVLPPDIVIKELSEVHLSFHPRRDAKSKEYVYRIHNGVVRCALMREYAWQVWGRLDLEAMQAAAQGLIGRHDFRSFCSTHTDVIDFEREISAIVISQKGALLEITMRANGFLRHMVRTIVGTLVAVGRGRIRAADIGDILAAKNRHHRGTTAPAHGLFLRRVDY